MSNPQPLASEPFAPLLTLILRPLLPLQVKGKVVASVIKCRLDFECLPFCLPLFTTRSELDSDVYCGAVGSLDGFN